MSSPTVLFRNQVLDNVFRSCVFGCTFWTACEVLDTWGAANTWWPYLGPARHPVESLVSFSVVAIHFIVPSRPLHFFFYAQLTARTPAIRAWSR